MSGSLMMKILHMVGWGGSCVQAYFRMYGLCVMNLYSKPLNEYLCVMQFTLIITVCMCNFFKH